MSDATFRIVGVEIEATSRIDFADATDRALARASEILPELGWFEVKRLGGRIQDGKRSEYRITFLMGR